jgi:hypothetical protein
MQEPDLHRTWFPLSHLSTTTPHEKMSTTHTFTAPGIVVEISVDPEDLAEVCANLTRALVLFLYSWIGTFAFQTRVLGYKSKVATACALKALYNDLVLVGYNLYTTADQWVSVSVYQPVRTWVDQQLKQYNSWVATLVLNLQARKTALLAVKTSP